MIKMATVIMATIIVIKTPVAALTAAVTFIMEAVYYNVSSNT